MTSLLGTLALSLGLLAAVAATTAWTLVAAGRVRHLAGARRASYGVLAAAAGACLVLEQALVRHDFSVRFVADNGGRDVPLYYTVTSLWGALEGSLLLWLLVLGGYAALLARRTPDGDLPLHAWARATTCAVAVFFFALALVGGNPFLPVDPVPADGPGPNPLLQDHPAMGVHPPLLYVGYVGLVVPFAYAVAALATGDPGRAWLRTCRTWAVVAWAFLSAGIVMGAWWSYAVLGWGGYWAWDPVENASLLPWLTTTALLHAVLVQERRGALRLWNVALATAGFLLVLLGTFLTRSGVVTSVHAFSEGALGPMLLGLLVVVLAAVAGLLAWRADGLGPPQRVGSLLSREAALLGNNLVLVAVAFTVLLGTLYPLATEALRGQRMSVGAPYFDRMAVPAALVLLALMAAGPLLRWDADRSRRVAQRLAAPVLAGSVLLVVAAVAGLAHPQALIAVGLAAAVVVSTAQRLLTAAGVGRRSRRRSDVAGLVRRPRLLGGALAHVGVAVVAAAVAVSATSGSVAQRDLAVGESLSVGGVRAELVGVDRARTDDRMTTRALLQVSGDRAPTPVAPELTFFSARSMVVSTPAVLTGLRRDVYVTVLAVREDGSLATVRLAVNPMVGWLWAGGALLALGGLLAAALPGGRRRRRPVDGESEGRQGTPVAPSDVPASDVPASDVPASDVPAPDVPAPVSRS